MTITDTRSTTRSFAIHTPARYCLIMPGEPLPVLNENYLLCTALSICPTETTMKFDRLSEQEITGLVDGKQELALQFSFRSLPIRARGRASWRKQLNDGTHVLCLQLSEMEEAVKTRLCSTFDKFDPSWTRQLRQREKRKAFVKQTCLFLAAVVLTVAGAWLVIHLNSAAGEAAAAVFGWPRTQAKVDATRINYPLSKADVDQAELDRNRYQWAKDAYQSLSPEDQEWIKQQGKHLKESLK